MKQNIAPMQLLLSIVERGSAAKLMRQYEAFKITQHFQTFGHGTAASHLLDTLGFGTSERDILLSIAPKDTMRQLMHFLKDEERSALGAKGIACSLDLTALSAIYALGISRLEEMNPDKGEQLMEQGNQHTLILVAVNYGYTDAVMDTARACGAKGGTIVRARWQAVRPWRNSPELPCRMKKKSWQSWLPGRNRPISWRKSTGSTVFVPPPRRW